MTYDFDSVISRENTASLKWNVNKTELPMWVADMDFKTAPEVIEAIRKRAEHGIFGYSEVTDEWYDAYISWWDKRHSFGIKKEWLIFCSGVVPAISSVVRKLTSAGENIVVQTPVYNVFFNSIRNNGCNVLQNALIYENGDYRMDINDLEDKLSDPQTSLMILCNPQNPSGKVWDKDTLKKVGDLCVKYHVTVISDEIHCDITSRNKMYTPFASVSDNCASCSITCLSPSKAFNLAGLQSAAVCIPDPFIRHKVWRALNTDEVAEPNAFAVTASVSAFNEGAAWLDALNIYIENNRNIMQSFIEKNIPWIDVVKGDATYLVWLDINRLSEIVDEGIYKGHLSRFVADFIRTGTGLFICDGEEYGKGREGFLRVNIACPESMLNDGLNRLKEGIEKLIRENAR